MNDLMHDPMFFYTIAFLIFLGLAWIYGRKPGLNWIDSEILKIRQELDHARKLRAEAEATLADYKAKQKAAMAEAESIVKHAKEEAARLKQESAEALTRLLQKHEQHGAERIRLAEVDAKAAVLNAAVDQAMKLARASLQQTADDGLTTRLADQAIADLAKLAGKRAEAA